MDQYTVNYHGFAYMHMDALCHGVYNGKMYNGFPVTAASATGRDQDSIIVAKKGLVTQGCSEMDIAALKGIEYLEPGTPIYQKISTPGKRKLA